jgi:transcriptional regulator with XRE-family HTH domain
MNHPLPARYCRSCGVRLAGSNRDDYCAPCQRKARALVTGPPEVPVEFWTTDRMRDALASWHMGRVIAAYRLNPQHPRPIPQEIVGGWVGITQAQLSRIENGPPIRDLDRLTQWATLLGIPADLLWFKLPGADPGPGDALAKRRSNAQPLAELPAPRSSRLLPTVNRRWRDTNADASAMRAFRAADKRVGGGHLYPAVVTYLHTEVGPRLFGSGETTGNEDLFAAAAALTEMAGWMAHDAGRDAIAAQHLDRAFALVRLSDDFQLGAHILASMSHLAHHRDQPETAIALARRGREALSAHLPHPELQARLLAMQAQGHATMMEAGECTRLLVEAERALDEKHAEEASEWVSRFDEGSLASEAARCMQQLGDLGEARRQAERVVALRPSDRTRSRAFGQLTLVRVLIAQGKPEEACALAQAVLDATQTLGSFLVAQQLLDLKHVVQRHRANSVVADFLSRLDEGLKERMWLGRWLSKDGWGAPTGSREGS